jgi:F-type H+-transporting ATPase subunit epsilon
MLDVVLLTPEEKVFEGKAESIKLPGEHGEFEIMSYHKPVISRLIGGSLIIDGRVYPVRRGIIGFNQNKATIIVER